MRERKTENGERRGENGLRVAMDGWEGLVYLLLDVGADVEVGEFVWCGGWVDAVREEDVHQIVLGVNPYHGTRKACVAEARLGGLWCDMGAFPVDEGFVET